MNARRPQPTTTAPKTRPARWMAVLGVVLCLGGLLGLALIRPGEAASVDPERSSAGPDGAGTVELASLRIVDSGVRIESVLPRSAAEPTEGPSAVALLPCLAGRVHPTAEIDLTEVRVLAGPSGQGLPLIEEPRDFLDDPTAYGFHVVACDADGTFVFGPELDAGRGYRLFAAGAGEAAYRSFAREVQVGDRVEIDLYPVVALDLSIEDEAGDAYEWGELEYLPFSYKVNNPPIVRAERAGADPYTLSAQPDPLTRALLDLPGHHANDASLVVCAYGPPAGGAPRFATLHVRARTGRARDLTRFDVELEPIYGGVSAHTLLVPGINTEFAPVTVHVPEALARDLVRADWPLLLEFEGMEVFRVQLDEGETSWTTRSIPPGEYRVSASVWLNEPYYALPRGSDADWRVRAKTRTRVGDAPADLFLPPLESALLRVAVGREFEVQRAQLARADDHFAYAPHFVDGLRADAVLLPLAWRASAGSTKAVSGALRTTDGGRYALVDGIGSTEFDVTSGTEVEVGLGPYASATESEVARTRRLARAATEEETGTSVRASGLAR